jgi:hypothetical protein
MDAHGVTEGTSSPDGVMAAGSEGRISSLASRAERKMGLKTNTDIL